MFPALVFQSEPAPIKQVRKGTKSVEKQKPAVTHKSVSRAARVKPEVPVSSKPDPAQPRPSVRVGYLLSRTLLTREQERGLALEIAQGRIDLVRALCAYPPALRVIGRWYASVANGSVEAHQVIDTYTIFRRGEMSEIPSTSPHWLSEPQKAEITKRALQITTLIASLDKAGHGNAETSDKLHAALRTMPLLDRHLGKLADRCLEAPSDGLDLSGILTANRRIDRSKKTLIDHNQGLCHWAGNHYQNRGLGRDDLIQEANVALSLAADRFDPERGTRFATFAVFWIRQCISRVLHDHGRTIRLPVHVGKDLGKIQQVTASLERRHEEVTPDILAHKTGLDPQRIKRLQEIAPPPVSLDAPFGDENETTLGDIIADRDTIDPVQVIFQAQLKKAIGNVLQDLKPREIDIITLRFGLDGLGVRTLGAIGDRYNVTRERIRQLETIALEKIDRHKHTLKKFGRDVDGLDVSRLAQSSSSGNRIDWNDETKQKRLEELRTQEKLSSRQIADKLTTEFGRPVSRSAVVSARKRSGLDGRPSPIRLGIGEPA